MSGNQGVKVYARIRPTSMFSAETIELHPDNKSITIHTKRDERRGYINNQILDWTYQTDHVLHNASQPEVFKRCAEESIIKSLDGYNSTIIAYGETGAGKSFTMSGSCENFQERGIIPRAVSKIFSEISNRKEQSVWVRISYLEIYNESMYDLLATIPGTRYVDPSSFTVTEDEDVSCRVKGLSVHMANTEEEALNLFFEGEMNRIVASHYLNRSSSRSHCIFTIYIETRSRVVSNAKYTVSKINLVDLAGSERIEKTQPEETGQQEAMYINKSLTFLEQVVIALGDKKRKHVPYRQCKLTHVLSDSIGGCNNTVLIANMWGEESQLEETLSTLRFAARMRCVYCEPAINEVIDPVKQCKQYENEIQFLKNELAMHDTLTNRSQVMYEPLSESQQKELKRQVEKYIAGEIAEMEIVNVRQIKEMLEIFRNIVNNVENETEKRLREKYIFQEKTPVETQDMGDSGPTAPVNHEKLLGEPDGKGFGIGVANAPIKGNTMTLLATRGKIKSRRGKDAVDPTETKRAETQGQDEGKSTATTGTRTQRQGSLRPTTPPPKSDAFVEFKQERGSEISRILHENKEILRDKKNTSRELSLRINATKVELDKVQKILEDKREERISMGGSVLPETEKEVIDEDEFQHLQKFQELKAQYLSDCYDLRGLMSGIQCCEKHVSQCRKKLVTEFDIWYTECYLGEENENSVETESVERKPRKSIAIEDEQEKFDRLQLEYLMDEPESVPYYNAQMQTQRRAYYTAVGRQRQKPVLTKRRTNEPPGILTTY